MGRLKVFFSSYFRKDKLKQNYKAKLFEKGEKPVSIRLLNNIKR